MSETRHPDRSSNARRRITEQAASWYLDHREGLGSVRDADFLAWLRRSPIHLEEYLAIAQLHGDLKAAASLETMSLEQLDALAATEHPVVPLRRETAMPAVARAPQAAARVPRRRTTRWMAAAGIAGLAVAGATTWHMISAPAMDVYTTTSTATREITLADGSLLRLDRDSAIAVRFDNRHRVIDVQRGGMLIDVGKDPQRPLQVTLGASVLRDVGTVFEARRQGSGGTVTVISGQVDVLAPGPSWPPSWLPLFGNRTDAGHVVANLAHGEQATLNGDGTLAKLTRQADLTRTTAWLPAEIRFEDSTVAEVARRFNAYSAQPLVIDDPAVASMRISGLFHAHDANAFVTYLSTLPGVRVLRDGNRIRIVGTGAEASHGARRL
jgi:transmembrane sensor